MRALMTALILLQLAGAARADDLYDRGRRRRQAGTVLLVVGAALLTAAPPLLLVGNAGYDCTALVGDYCGPTLPYYLGIGFAVGGAVMHAIGLPLFVSGTNDVNHWRDGKTASLAEVRF
jgi:hypothetical protein